MGYTFQSLWQDDSGQDLTEYTLIIAFITFVTAALFLGSRSALDGIWTTGNDKLDVANKAAS